jgi:hypothetical protein
MELSGPEATEGNDPRRRTAFINQVAAPIANKLFECGVIP